MVGRYGLYVEMMVFPSLSLPYVFTRRQSTVRHFCLILKTNHDYSVELGCKNTSSQPLLTLVIPNFRQIWRRRAEWEGAFCATLVNRTRPFYAAVAAVVVASIMSAAMGGRGWTLVRMRNTGIRGLSLVHCIHSPIKFTLNRPIKM
jgi:hypothetical protein